jgi:hypothetical protein
LASDPHERAGLQAIPWKDKGMPLNTGGGHNNSRLSNAIQTSKFMRAHNVCIFVFSIGKLFKQ